MMKATKEQLYAAIEREKQYQERKWPQDGKPLDLHGRMIVAYEELREARLAYCEHTSNDEALRELLQVVAVGARIYENNNNWRSLILFYEEPDRTLPEWLECLEHQFALARGHATVLQVEEVFRQLKVVIAMGTAALLQHGIVERETFSLPSDSKEENMTPEAAAYLQSLEARNATNPSARVLNPDSTQRGLFLLEFTDRNLGRCDLQKSSLATEDAIWIGLSDDRRMHLTQQDVQALLPFLIRFVETGELDAL